MTATVEKLFLHVSEKNFHPYLNIAEHHYYSHAEEKAETRIRQFLPPDQIKLLEELRQNVSVELEAAFQAGLAIGLELSRL